MFFPKEKHVNFIKEYKIYILKNACKDMHLILKISLLPRLATEVIDTQFKKECLLLIFMNKKVWF